MMQSLLENLYLSSFIEVCVLLVSYKCLEIGTLYTMQIYLFIFLKDFSLIVNFLLLGCCFVLTKMTSLILHLFYFFYQKVYQYFALIDH